MDTEVEKIDTEVKNSNKAEAPKELKRDRKFVITWNNYTDKEVEILRKTATKAEYCIFGYEVAPTTGTKHIQGYIRFKNPRATAAIRKLFKGAHVECAKGDDADSKKYCSKEGTYEEFGVCREKKPGDRTDLQILRDKIIDGYKVDDVAINDPEAFHSYGRTLNKIEEITMRKKFRTEMTTCEWFVGPTGTGKSHEAFKNFHPDTHYVVRHDNGWWEGYTQQETVIFNDFRGDLAYNELLQIIDKWPHWVKRRGREPMPFISKHVIITCSLYPEEVYNKRNERDSIEQLLRRISITELSDRYFPETDSLNSDTDTEVVGVIIDPTNTEAPKGASDLCRYLDYGLPPITEGIDEYIAKHHAAEAGDA